MAIGKRGEACDGSQPVEINLERGYQRRHRGSAPMRRELKHRIKIDESFSDGDM